MRSLLMSLLISLMLPGAAYASGSNVQSQSGGQASSPCSSGYDASGTDTSGMKDTDQARYHALMTVYLRDRLATCAMALSRLSRVRAIKHADICDPASYDRIDSPPNSGAKDPDIVTYNRLLAVTIDKYCALLYNDALAYVSTPQQLLYTAGTPTIYVLLGSGAPQGGGGGGGSGKGGGGGGGGGFGGSSGASSSTDNPSALLLHLVAQRLQNTLCARKSADPPNAKILPKGTSAPCSDGNTTVHVLPEAQWTVEDFRAQCVGDPLVESKGEGHGTVAGIILNGAITSQDGAFHLLDITAGTEANFSAELVRCNARDSAVDAPPNEMVFSDLISSGTTTWRISLFPIALAGTLIAANLSAKSQYNSSPAASLSGPALTAATLAFQQTNTSLTIGQALGQFAAGLSSMTIGNGTSGLTLHRTFDNWAEAFALHLNAYCSHPGNITTSPCSYFPPVQ